MAPRDRDGPGGPRDGENGHATPVGAHLGTAPNGAPTAAVVVEVTEPILGRGLCLASIRVGKQPKKKRRHVSFGSTETITYRVKHSMQPTGPIPPQQGGPAHLPGWEEREWAAARAVRSAAELAYHVGMEAHGKVLFWDGEIVYVLPFKDSVGIPEDRCRFLCGPGRGLPDVEVVRYPEAMEKFGRKFGTHRHFGHVPKAPAMEGKDVAGGAEIRKRVKRTFLEFCCSPTSLLCDPQFTDGHTRLIRLTEKEDMTTKGGLEFALDYAQRSDAGCIMLFGALPCTWGTSW